MTTKCTWVSLPDELSSSFAQPKPCTNDAVWKDRCPEHGGTYPTVYQLMMLLADMTGWSDQMLTVNMRCMRPSPGTRQRVVWLVSTTICGTALQATASGNKLEIALWELSKAIAEKLKEAERTYAESAETAESRLNKFLENKA